MRPATPRVVLVIENIAFAKDHRLRKQATALLAAGYRVSVVCRRDPRNQTCVPGVQVVDYPAPKDGSSKAAFVWEYGYSLLMAGWALLRIFIREGFDVLQLSSTPDIYFLLAIPYRWLGRRVIFDYKDLSPETYAARYGSTSGPMYRALLVMERASLRAADQVLVVNGSLRDLARERGGVAPERITIVGNGPTLDRLAGREPRPELRRGRDHLCVWVGMISPQDHLDLAVRTFAQLVVDLGRTDCGFTVIGIGDSLPSVQALARELGVEDYVHFAGWAEPDLVFDYLATADLGVEPGLEDFVSPVKAMEFMAAGLPFVAYDVQETVAIAEGAAAYAGPGDTKAMAGLIDALLDDPARRREMGLLGAQQVRDVLAWEHQAQRYIAVVSDLVSSVAGGRTGRGKGSP